MDDKHKATETLTTSPPEVDELRHEFSLKLVELEGKLTVLETRFSMLGLWGALIVVLTLEILVLFKPLVQA